MQNVFWLALQKLILKRFVVFFLNTVISPRFRYKPLRLYNFLKPLNKMYKRRLNNKRQLTVCSSSGTKHQFTQNFWSGGGTNRGRFPWPLHVGLVALYSHVPFSWHFLVSDIKVSGPYAMWYPSGHASVQVLKKRFVPSSQSAGVYVPIDTVGSFGQRTSRKTKI